MQILQRNTNSPSVTAASELVKAVQHDLAASTETCQGPRTQRRLERIAAGMVRDLNRLEHAESDYDERSAHRYLNNILKRALRFYRVIDLRTKTCGEPSNLAWNLHRRAMIMNIGKNIKVIRTAAEVNQKELADRLDISASYLSLIESGEREPSLSVLKAISRELDIPFSALFFDPNDLPANVSPARAADRERVNALMDDVLHHLLAKRPGRKAVKV